jgi:hypothetical protein
MSDNIKDELNKTFDALIRSIDNFDNESFNKVPSYSGWNAGQVCEHLLKSNVVPVLYGNTESTERNSDEKIDEIGKIFLDFSSKYKNPDFNTPLEDRHDRNEMKSTLQQIHKDAVRSAEECDLTKLCMDMELPGLGHLTGIEMLYFMAYHYQRHTHQIDNILNDIN